VKGRNVEFEVQGSGVSTRQVSDASPRLVMPACPASFFAELTDRYVTVLINEKRIFQGGSHR